MKELEHDEYSYEEKEEKDLRNKDWERKALKVVGGAVGTAGSALIGATGFTPKPSFIGGVIGSAVPIVGYGIKKGVDYEIDRRKKNKENAESNHRSRSKNVYLKLAIAGVNHGLEISKKKEDEQIMLGLYRELRDMKNPSLEQAKDIQNRINEQIEILQRKRPPPLPKAKMDDNRSEPEDSVDSPQTKKTLEERKIEMIEYAQDIRGKSDSEKIVIQSIINALPDIKTNEEMDKEEAKLVNVQMGKL